MPATAPKLGLSPSCKGIPEVEGVETWPFDELERARAGCMVIRLSYRQGRQSGHGRGVSVPETTPIQEWVSLVIAVPPHISRPAPSCDAPHMVGLTR